MRSDSHLKQTPTGNQPALPKAVSFHARLECNIPRQYVSTINIQNSSGASSDSSNPKSYVWKTLSARYFWMLSECWILLNAIFNLNSALPFIWSIGCLNVFCQHSLFAINVGLCFCSLSQLVCFPLFHEKIVEKLNRIIILGDTGGARAARAGLCKWRKFHNRQHPSSFPSIPLFSFSFKFLSFFYKREFHLTSPQFIFLDAIASPSIAPGHARSYK